MTLISVISCAHNEEEYVDRFLKSLLNSLKGFHYEIIFVADRCTDSTIRKVEKYSSYNIKILKKNWRKWRNSYAEALQFGFANSNGNLISIMDVDLIVPRHFFKVLVPKVKGRTASVAASIITYPDTLMNKIVFAWEKTYRIAPLGKRPYGAARIIQRVALERVGGFRDVFSTDTDLDLRLDRLGYESVVIPSIIVYHARRSSVRASVKRQVRLGRGRYMIGFGLIRTIGHSIFRLKPFILAGWLIERLQNPQKINPIH
ncbi:TPA: glycosyltransferase [Candidatus Bathyarchaeota archaeon]|nr:glycosyltransferase [Candidatus Bathyarchaeota archaeon]